MYKSRGLQGQRAIRQRKRLTFRNPFNSSGFKNPSRVMTAPIMREGMTSDETQASMASKLGISEKLMKRAMHEGIIDDPMGADLSKYVNQGTSVSLPGGVASLEEAARQQDIARQVQQYNAKVLTQEQMEKKALYELTKKRQLADYRSKIVEWLALTDEIDEVPNEFREEVEKYYQQKGNEYKKQETADKRKARKEKEEEEKKKKWEGERYIYDRWSKQPFSNIGMQRNKYASMQYTTPQKLALSSQEENASREAAKRLRDTNWDRWLRHNQPVYTSSNIPVAAVSSWPIPAPPAPVSAPPAPTPDEAQAMLDDVLAKLPKEEKEDEGKTKQAASGSGWRAPRLYSLVRPSWPFYAPPDRTWDYEDQKQARADNREFYGKLMKQMYGHEVPKDMKERAFPNHAEALRGLGFLRPKLPVITGAIVPHPYIFGQSRIRTKPY